MKRCGTCEKIEEIAEMMQRFYDDKEKTGFTDVLKVQPALITYTPKNRKKGYSTAALQFRMDTVWTKMEQII